MQNISNGIEFAKELGLKENDEFQVFWGENAYIKEITNHRVKIIIKGGKEALVSNFGDFLVLRPNFTEKKETQKLIQDITETDHNKREELRNKLGKEIAKVFNHSNYTILNNTIRYNYEYNNRNSEGIISSLEVVTNDVNGFKSISKNLSVDSKTGYYRNNNLTNIEKNQICDPKTLKPLKYGVYSQDKNNIYFRMHKMQGATIIGNNYEILTSEDVMGEDIYIIRDSNNNYFCGRHQIEFKNPNKVKLIHDLISDEDNVYLLDGLICGITKIENVPKGELKLVEELNDGAKIYSIGYDFIYLDELGNIQKVFKCNRGYLNQDRIQVVVQKYEDY